MKEEAEGEAVGEPFDAVDWGDLGGDEDHEADADKAYEHGGEGVFAGVEGASEDVGE